MTELVPVERQLPCAIPQDIDDIDNQLAVEHRWSIARFIIGGLLFISGIVVSVLLGLFYRQWL